MKLLIIILWAQVLAALVCMYVAFAGIHTGAMQCEWTNHLRAEYKKLAASPDFKVPADVGGTRHERFPDILHSLAKDSMHNAGYWFFFSGAVAAAGASMLFLAYRDQKTKQT